MGGDVLRTQQEQSLAATSLQSLCDSVRPHRWQPTSLPCPWDSPGKNTGVGCHFLLQCMKMKSESEVSQSCPALSDPMDCNLPGSSVHGIFQARVLEWDAIAFSEYSIVYMYHSFLINSSADSWASFQRMRKVQKAEILNDIRSWRNNDDSGS